MQTARKIRLLPTPEQEKQYQIYLENGKTGTCFAKEGEVRKYINNVNDMELHW